MPTAAIPPRHARWGHPKGEGSDLSIPPGTKAEYVDLSKAFNQNLRLLHKGRYSPRHKHSTLQANGRSWWERHEVVDNRHWPKDYYVPKKLDWPADGHLVTKYGPAFRLGPADGTNAVFVSFYKQFPDAVEIPLSGRARKIALLTAVVTNPNVAWMEAAVVKVRYADGTEAAQALAQQEESLRAEVETRNALINEPEIIPESIPEEDDFVEINPWDNVYKPHARERRKRRRGEEVALPYDENAPRPRQIVIEHREKQEEKRRQKKREKEKSRKASQEAAAEAVDELTLWEDLATIGDWDA